jgi:hypothetical protein
MFRAARWRQRESASAIESWRNSIKLRRCNVVERAGGTLGPHEERLRRTQNKLHAALERLIAGRPIDPTLRKIRYRLTVSALAREASAGRNAIYTNHRAIIEELRQATVQNGRSPPDSARSKLDGSVRRSMS